MLISGQQNDIGDACLTIAIIIVTLNEEQSSWLHVLQFMGCAEALILTSHALGCNYVDVLAAYIVSLIVRIKTFAGKLRLPKYSVVSKRI